MTADDRARRRAWMRSQYQDSARLRTRANLHARFSTSRTPWYEWLFRHLDLAPGSMVLELGCGPGDLWIRNADRLPERCRVILTDLSEGMVREARAALGGRGAFRWMVADAEAIPFAPERFDAVVANQMLSHVPGLPAALSEIRGVLRPGGRLYAGTTGRRDVQELVTLLRAFDPAVRWDIDEGRYELETAERHLGPYFRDIRIDRFLDTLVVSEAGPLVDYVFSMTPPMAPVPAKRAAFHAYVAQRLAASGPIRISRATGVVTAVRT